MGNNKSKFEVIVPYFNDFENFIKFNEIIDSVNTKDIKFLFLDNGSDDDEIKKYFSNKNYENRKLIISEKNLGYGGGIIYAQNFVESDFIAWMPGNLKINPIDSIPFFINAYSLLSKNTLIKAERINRQTLDFIKTTIFGFLSTLYFRANLNDAGGTPSIVHRSFFNNCDDYPTDFSFDVFVYYLFRKNRKKIIRPKIKYTKRFAGSSHWQKGIVSEIKLTLEIFSYKKNWNKIIKDK